MTFHNIPFRIFAHTKIKHSTTQTDITVSSDLFCRWFCILFGVHRLSSSLVVFVIKSTHRTPYTKSNTLLNIVAATAAAVIRHTVANTVHYSRWCESENEIGRKTLDRVISRLCGIVLSSKQVSKLLRQSAGYCNLTEFIFSFPYCWISS